jgi:hypothetical protein
VKGPGSDIAASRMSLAPPAAPAQAN